MKKDQREFIVVYSPSFCEIVEADYGERGLDKVFEYKECALPRNKGSKYGDPVAWKNVFLCSVMANNAKEALDIFMRKMKNADYRV